MILKRNSRVAHGTNSPKTAFEHTHLRTLSTPRRKARCTNSRQSPSPFLNPTQPQTMAPNPRPIVKDWPNKRVEKSHPRPWRSDADFSTMRHQRERCFSTGIARLPSRSRKAARAIKPYAEILITLYQLDSLSSIEIGASAAVALFNEPGIGLQTLLSESFAI